MKRCYKCGETKPVSEFSVCRRNKDGLQSSCKTCAAEYNAANFDRIKKQKAEYQAANREKIVKQRAGYYVSHCKEFAEYHATNRDRILKRQAERRANHREETAEYNAKYSASHRKERAEYLRNRRANDIQYRLAHNIRSRLSHAVKGNYKSGSAVRDLGCSIAELKKHLEKQFQPGMSWDNYGPTGWHIDHIKPLDAFNLEDREQLLEACHYTNLQPMWAAENIRKRNKVVASQANVSEQEEL